MVVEKNVGENKESLRDVAGVICRNIIALNPAENVVYRPYSKEKFVKRELGAFVKINLNEFFGNGDSGDYCYVEVNLLCQCDTMVLLTVKGAEEVWVNGIKKDYADNEHHISAALRKNDNSLVFKCCKQHNNFGVEYMVSYPCYPWLWTCDYILWVRDSFPVYEYMGEQGFSVSELVCAKEVKQWSECKIIYPKKTSSDENVDFNLLYGNEKGRYAFTYTCVKKDGVFKLSGSKKYVKIFVNGEERKGLETDVKENDVIYIVSERNNENWGYVCESCNIIGLPFVTSNRKDGLHYIHIGAFNEKTIPDFSIDSPCINAGGEYTFWRFTDEKTYLRPYLDTSLFGQWFYGIMVALNGLMNARDVSEEYYSYFEKSMTVLAKFYRYMQYDAQKFGDSTFLKRSIHTADLDSIGTIGMNMYELYVRTSDSKLKKEIMYILETLAKSVYTKIPRLADGTFCRKDVIWADDTYMSCPFLVRMGRLTGNTKYYDEVVSQLKHYFELMFLEDKGVFAHIYWVNEKRNNGVPWGRGNGWVYLSFAEVLENLPENYPGKDELEKLFVKAVEGLVKYQAQSGRWRQVLTMEASYGETSCTAIFCMALEKGIKLGILDRRIYLPIVKKAVEGIIKYSVDESGNILGVCRGSGCCDDAGYYASLGTVLNDAHGTGVVVSAICGLIDLTEDSI